ncbi:Malate/lactate/ureidoglycolate dehydrogenase, LDH2 family [Natronincola peptidivorans]|uniref:Malate/lactate/ureidoglycolate dehydrogenase, LDH2 family n=2 Tax=Natronincola peptidivorans TaxID=426128 RepID=A0A1I0CC48_9FIRM|nr:Malate/lactate/ureidoglycolate dehydrogenase, LDH2 family [Natronincola peptidivorans]
MKIIQWEPLRDLCQKLYEAQGMPADEAFLVADSLVDADLSGVESHGVSRMPIYMKRIEEKVVTNKCRVEVEKEFPGGLALNACNSMGIVAGVKVMEMGIKKAKESGFAFITVSHSNHFGTAAYFTRQALKENMIAFAATNAPSTMAPWGGIKAYLGTNPFSVAIPAGDQLPIIMDMATSVVAQGKIIMAAKTNESIPEGWAINKEGVVTTDPKEALEGTVLPFGGPKGYGIALLVDILSGILSGAMFGPHLNNMWNDFENPQNVGHCFAILDISKYIEVESFKSRIDQMIQEIKTSPKAKGVEEIFMPGEIEHRKSMKRREEGIPVSSVVYEDLKALAEKWNVAFTI